MAGVLVTNVTVERPKRTSAWIADVVQRAVFAGKLKPGDRIVEGALAKELGVGISQVREALQQLEHLGLVTRHLNRGTFVIELTPTELEQLYRLRTELEALSVKCAVEARNPSGLERLQELADQMLSAGAKRDLLKFAEYDLQFHLQIPRVAKDPFLEKTLLILLTPLFGFDVIRVQQQSRSLDFVAMARKHQEIVDICRMSDATQAAEAMRLITKSFYRDDIKKLYGNEQAEHPSQ